MKTYADKKQAQIISNESVQQRSKESAPAFVDNRPEAVAQRKLIEMANNSQQVKKAAQLKAMIDNSPQVKQAAQLKAMINNSTVNKNYAGVLDLVQKKENNTGLPDNLKAGVENLSGMAMDDVRVHYNSSKPAQLNAYAYTQGTDIHVAPGQEKHLPHEAWHVVQQKQGRVQPTMQMAGGLAVNDDKGLEREADGMGEQVLQRSSLHNSVDTQSTLNAYRATQLKVLQCARPINDILNFIDQNRENLGPVSGSHIRRLMYWNDQGYFDVKNGNRLKLNLFNRAMSTKIPKEKENVDENKLKEFMRIRSEFGVNVPNYFGGGKIWFRKRPESNIFQGRAWISDNIYWRSENDPRVRYMIHAILEWANGIEAIDPPTVHITLRNAETQVKIDLDISNPLPNSRITGEREVTMASFSQGLGVNRNPGQNMVNDENSFANLRADTTQQWLTDLQNAAQNAIVN